jgi:RNA-directed DNA polymerase
MHDNLAGRRRADYAAAICTIRPYARFAPVCPPEKAGWVAYYRTVVSTRVFAALTDYLWKLTYKWACWRRGRNLHAGQAQVWTEEWFNGHGLYRLRGTVRYPKAA